MVVRDGQVTEDRVLLRKNKTKKRVENAALETRFRSLYSAFLPATLFAADKQPAFFYRLEKHEKMYGRPAARLAVAPRPGFEELGAGTAWVDEETGAVLKIELAQRAIKGIEAAEKRAQRSGARLAGQRRALLRGRARRHLAAQLDHHLGILCHQSCRR